ncbi:hypothetical protein [Mesorhizobium sp. L103C131B0]|uniref:hypothetical protein n=1 Tax=Mesorhizobium sp. L103C131B0 TaxID=1287089 RepID=UPI0003D01D37|nr:hypothetical protein [Mesorhizobium sp. L103C131B0]ESZ64761.1 hypothetical protein X729_05590 [Mesorhizobium sp. L103C131B0]
MNDAWRDGKANLVSIVAPGGLGKSALVNHWLSEIAAHSYDGARVFGWSFYAQGVTHDFSTSSEFIQAALTWFGDPEPPTGDENEKGRRLATLVRARPTILVLDGLEPLQSPPGQSGGEVTDPALKALLASLASDNSGLCVVTTRYHIPNLERFGASVAEIEIAGLQAEDGIELLRSLGVRGSDTSLALAVSEYDGHPLALLLLGTFLTIVHDGSVERRVEIPLRAWDSKQGGKARRIMESYKRWFGDRPALQILRILGLFDRPADVASLSAVRRAPPITGLTDGVLDHVTWATEIHALRRAGLIFAATPERAGELDTHPLIREFFGSDFRETNGEAWIEGHERILAHLSSSTVEQPDTLVAMFPLFVAINHGCKAGRYKEALRSIYIDRIQRGRTTYYSTKRFGIPTQHLSALYCFFDEERRSVRSELDGADRIYVLLEVAYEMRALGRLHDAIPILLQALDEGVRMDRIRECAATTDVLAETYLHIGEIASALSFARETVAFAKRCKRDFELMYSHCALANVQHFAGDMSGARLSFEEAEKVQARRQSGSPRLKSLNGAQFCDYLISIGSVEEAVSRLREIVEQLGKDEGAVIAKAICEVVLARALHKLNPDSAAEPTSLLNGAIRVLRGTGQNQELAMALIARVALSGSGSSADDLTHFRADVVEAQVIAEESRSMILQAEAADAFSRLYTLEADSDAAGKYARTAADLREQLGYRRPPISGPLLP